MADYCVSDAHDEFCPLPCKACEMACCTGEKQENGTWRHYGKMCPMHTDVLASEQEYEYCVMQEGIPGLFRGPWSADECRSWIQRDEMGMRSGTYYIARRVVGPWEKSVDNEKEAG